MNDTGIAIGLSGKRGSGLFMLVSEEDARRVQGHKWFLVKHGYPCANVRDDGKDGTVKVHLFLFGTSPGRELDHINRNKLDNRRCNLRWLTHAENMQNTAMRRGNRSGFRGVRWHAKTGAFQARINLFGKTNYLGYFDTAQSAGARVEEFLKEHAIIIPTLADNLAERLNPTLRRDRSLS